jgi:hypothetical protein
MLNIMYRRGALGICVRASCHLLNVNKSRIIPLDDSVNKARVIIPDFVQIHDDRMVIGDWQSDLVAFISSDICKTVLDIDTLIYFGPSRRTFPGHSIKSYPVLSFHGQYTFLNLRKRIGKNTSVINYKAELVLKKV